jgi:ATP-dependent exoDNAse (exonuclease V) alpha subunit
VLAARRAKVDQINAVHASERQVASIAVEAIDSAAGERPVVDSAIRDLISERLSGMPRRLDLHVGQLLVITVNRRRTHAGFVNGSLAVITALSPAHAPTELEVRLLDEEADAPTMRVRRIEATCTVNGAEYKRLMFPVIPAFAMTIHRVQGATLTGDVHVLLNREIFAEGQAYVALSRVQRLEQLHLWCLERTAIKGHPAAAAEYARLSRFPLDEAAIAAAPRRERVRHLLPLVAAPPR